MITRLRLTNFKAWRELELRFATVTGIFGANSAGKSSLIQFLLLLKQTRDATDRRIVLDFGVPESPASLGTFRDVVHGRDAAADISWELAWALPEPLEIPAESADRQPVEFTGREMEMGCTVGLSDAGKSPTLFTRNLSYRIGNHSLLYESTSGMDNKSVYELQVRSDCDFKPLRIHGRRPSRSSSPVKAHVFPDQLKRSYQNADFLSDLELAYEDLMDRIYYLGPLRVFPKRQYYWNGASPADVGPSGERAMDAVLAATAREAKRQLKYRAHKLPFQKVIAHWLRELGLIDRFSMSEIGAGSNLYQAHVATNASAVATTLSDVGIGVSQVLPVLVLLYYVPEGSVVLLEQPEIHLHPAVQSHLADFFLCVAKQRKLQIVVESHSQHMLQRLQRRVAEGEVGVPGKGSTFPFEISSDDVRLYFSSVSRGAGRLEDLRLNEWGEIENWPDGFFGDEMEEIAAISSATIRRKLADRTK